MRSSILFVTLAAAWVGCGSTATAQAVRFLIPETFTPAANVDLPVRVEADREISPWPADRVEWLFVRGSGRQANRHDVQPDQPGGESVTVRTSANGVTMIGLDLAPTIESHSRDVLMKSLATLTAEPPSLPNRVQIRVRRIESLTTLVRVEPLGGHAPVATQKSGQRVEIRALFDPTMATPGSDVPVRVYYEGGGAGGIKIHAECLDGGAATQVIADRSGIAYLPITHTGVWRVQAHAAASAFEGSGADVILHSATLTFKVTKEADQ